MPKILQLSIFDTQFLNPGYDPDVLVSVFMIYQGNSTVKQEEIYNEIEKI